MYSAEREEGKCKCVPSTRYLLTARDVAPTLREVCVRGMEGDTVPLLHRQSRPGEQVREQWDRIRVYIE